jgi:hypothetical protein
MKNRSIRLKRENKKRIQLSTLKLNNNSWTTKKLNVRTRLKEEKKTGGERRRWEREKQKVIENKKEWECEILKRGDLKCCARESCARESLQVVNSKHIMYLHWFFEIKTRLNWNYPTYAMSRLDILKEEG